MRGFLIRKAKQITIGMRGFAVHICKIKTRKKLFIRKCCEKFYLQ